MIIIILGILLCGLAGIAKAIQDTLAHHFSSSIFRDGTFYKTQFWDSKKSWINKWDYSSGSKKEKFLGSSTIFVFMTDAWHLFQLLHLNILILGVFMIGIQFSLWGLLVAIVLYRVIFELNYRWILKM